MKCKLCGTRLEEGATKCPVCGASVSENGEATTAPVMENINLSTYKCPSCKADIVGEHRFCTQCGVNLQQAAQEYETKATADKDETVQKKSFCPQCGAEIPDGAKFCNECGAKIGTDTSHEEPARSGEENGNSEINSAQVQKPLGKTKSKKKVIIAVVVIVAVLGIIGNLIEENESSSSRGNYSYSSSNASQNLSAQDEYNLGASYYNGAGKEQNYSLAFQHFSNAANQGHAGAQGMVGYMYQAGIGVEKNPQKAVGYYEKAAKQGSVLAQLNLGLMYYHGNGVAQSNQKALEYFTMAANQGNEEAKKLLQELGWN